MPPLGALPTAAAAARAHARTVLRSWRIGGDLAHDVQTVISELVTNAGAPRGALSYPRRSRDELKGGSWA
jgi:hypothetical protein